MWEWSRAGDLNATDFLALLEKIGEQPDCAGLIQRGRLLPAGWRKELADLFALVRDESATLIAGLARLEEPMHGGLAYALACEQLLGADQLPPRVLVETATKVVLGDFTVVRDLLAQRLPWPKEVLAEAAAQVIITTSPSGRVDDIQDFLALAAPATQRRLFEVRGYGVVQMAVLPAALDELMAVAEPSDFDELRRKAAFEPWAQVFPPGSLPARFEGLAAKVMAEGGSGASLALLMAVVSEQSRERLLLGLSRKTGLLACRSRNPDHPRC